MLANLIEKYFARTIKYLGLFFIITFCTANILFSLTKSDLTNSINSSEACSQKSDIFNCIIDQTVRFSTYFEEGFFDYRRRQTLNNSSKNSNIVLVAIDDISINKIGVWPLPRINYAKLIDQLNHFGAKTIAFDVFFPEMSTSCKSDDPSKLPEKKMVESFDKFQNKRNKNGKLIGNSIIMPYSVDRQATRNTFEEMPSVLFDNMINSRTIQKYNLEKFYVSKNVFPIGMFANSGITLSHIIGEPDKDGVFRNYQLISYVDELYLPSLALSVYENYTNTSHKSELKTAPFSSSLTLKNKDVIDINSMGQTKIRWIGNEEYYHKVSFYDVLTAKPDNTKFKALFKDAIIFIGSTAFGAHDLRQTPIGSITPGVYTHMAMTDMLLNRYHFQDKNDSIKMSWALLILGSLLIFAIQYIGNPILDLSTMCVLVLGLYHYDTYYLIPQGYDTKLFFTLLSIISIYSWNTFLHFYFANKDKAFLKHAFGSYISPELIDEMYHSKTTPSLGGESGIRTAFFTDIQGFSTFSEKLSATKLVELLNEYLSVMTDILLEEGGTLDKYEGDAIIAFFGAPMPLPDHAKRACVVAHRMQLALLDLRKKWASEGDKWPVVVHSMRMRIGINTGELVTGNMGSHTRMNYTMMGDTVNLAARLEEAAKQYGIFTQVSTSTKEEAEDFFVWRELDTIKVVGKSQPVTTYEPLGLTGSIEENLEKLAQTFNQAIKNYKAKEFKEAIQLFKVTLEIEYDRFPELKGVKANPSEIYLNRCEEYLKNPPETDWDGVYTLTSK